VAFAVMFHWPPFPNLTTLVIWTHTLPVPDSEVGLWYAQVIDACGTGSSAPFPDNIAS
jgi:hypothetical protein